MFEFLALVTVCCTNGPLRLSFVAVCWRESPVDAHRHGRASVERQEARCHRFRSLHPGGVGPQELILNSHKLICFPFSKLGPVNGGLPCFFSFVLLPFYSCHLQTASKADGARGIPCGCVWYCDRISRRAGTPCVSWVTSVLGSCPWKRRRSRAVLPPPCSILRLVK